MKNPRHDSYALDDGILKFGRQRYLDALPFLVFKEERTTILLR